jgi:hypothetical protein
MWLSELALIQYLLCDPDKTHVLFPLISIRVLSQLIRDVEFPIQPRGCAAATYVACLPVTPGLGLGKSFRHALYETAIIIIIFEPMLDQFLHGIWPGHVPGRSAPAPGDGLGVPSPSPA